MNTTDFRPALLWVMGQIGEDHKQAVLTAFDQQFGPLIPESQRKVNEKDGKESWRITVGWSSADLVTAGLLHKHPGRKGIWSITDAGRELLAQPLSFQEAREEVLHRINNPPSATGSTSLPSTLGRSLKPYVRLATHLNDPTYTPDEIVDRLGRIDPPIVPGLTQKPDSGHLVRDLLRLRLLEPLDAGRYRRWPHLADNTEPHLLRYAALTMLVPSSDGGYLLPILTAPLDGRPHPAAAWPLGETLPQWYAEAGLVERTPDGMWQATPDALTPLAGETPTIQAINTFLTHLQQARSSQHDLEPIRDDALRWLDADTLEEGIREIQRALLIDRSTILRIYRALVAGQHVILSGPPGTGKTHLAGLLPRILWRDTEDTMLLSMPTDPQRPPTDPPDEQRLRRQGYAVEVVTATEDWGIRDVIGGIAPRLERTGQGRNLVYTIRHGCLTRAVLHNYTGYDGETVPAVETLRRRELADDSGQRYRGRWLVIDEFTRAPVDAAFGSLLTTLGGQRSPLMVPTDAGDVAVPLPRDFRIIGTLNSFDRHFLNQISEAMKRRFVFIDILPPGREQAAAEQGMAIYRAMDDLAQNGMLDVTIDAAQGRAVWEDFLSVERTEDENSAIVYRVEIDDADLQVALRDLWRIFSAIRIYRQLGTAQAQAVASALCTGSSVGMGWAAALDAALADTLADQLQVLNRDEQRVLLAFLEHADEPEQFTEQVRGILHLMPGPRQLAHLTLLKAVAPDATSTFDPTKLAGLTSAHLGRLFDLGPPLLVDAGSLFARRLNAFVHERGL
jgi:hypothetical protein